MSATEIEPQRRQGPNRRIIFALGGFLVVAVIGLGLLAVKVVGEALHNESFSVEVYNDTPTTARLVTPCSGCSDPGLVAMLAPGASMQFNFGDNHGWAYQVRQNNGPTLGCLVFRFAGTPPGDTRIADISSAQPCSDTGPTPLRRSP